MSGEHGAVSLLLLATAGLVVVLAVLLADVGGFLAARLQASAAADAAALAAAPVTFRPFGSAGSPVDEAARFAVANGARLVTCRCPVDPSWERREVEVVVAVSVDLAVFGATEAQAKSRAEFVPTELLGARSSMRGPMSERRTAPAQLASSPKMTLSPERLAE